MCMRCECLIVLCNRKKRRTLLKWDFTASSKRTSGDASSPLVKLVAEVAVEPAVMMSLAITAGFSHKPVVMSQYSTVGPKPATRGGVNGSRSKFLPKFKLSAYIPKITRDLKRFGQSLE